ncbi:hypothetical protein EW026_g910 [Hermanssonia centrifuga]|uniref:HBS1-like protein N-terminal domain-containing protein n=1 Tax=Hermanssonia centrifuga TaxID=98765 RepID=A0A4S4KT67_9APHY|nr:hypothetical protein EW026_g910 [Hermanssonia centrifuga]
MSRHRLIRNMNIEDEMDDEAMDDGEDLSPEDLEQLTQGLEQIRATVGSEAESGMTDKDIKDALYHYYFDIQQSLNWLLEEQARKHAAQERRGERRFILIS